MKAVYEINGYGVVLAQVQNYYPVEENDKSGTYYWGFKYMSGVFEYFHYSNRYDANKERDEFVIALNYYWVKEK